jgi:hypothetical protein
MVPALITPPVSARSRKVVLFSVFRLFVRIKPTIVINVIPLRISSICTLKYILQSAIGFEQFKRAGVIDA